MKSVLSKVAGKALHGFDAPTRMRIRIAIEAIPNGDIKMLQGQDGLFRLRVGKYRVLFTYMKRDETDVVAILDIGSRGDIYK